MNHKRHLAFAALGVLVLAPITYLILVTTYQLPVQASEEAEAIDALFTGHFLAISFMFALVMVFTLYSVIVFRRRPDDDSDGEFIHGSNALEVAWTVIPLIIVLGFGVWGWTTLDDVVKAETNETVIEVYGQQWNWSFKYPEFGEFAEDATLVLELNQPVLLQMEARDVLHSFWVPEFRVKQDLIPGRKTTLRITPTEAGNYTLRCAEICGKLHSVMLAEVRVLNPTAYAAWAEETRAIASLPPEAQGELKYEANCASCHSIDGSAGVGPSWAGLYQRQEQMADGSTITATDDYIRQSICEPNSQIVAGFQPNAMPLNFCEGVLSDRDIGNIIEFIKTLESAEQG